MENTKIKIPGSVKPDTKHQSIRTYFPQAEIRSFNIGITRGSEAAMPTVELNNNDVVVTEFEDGIQWFHNAGDFINKLQTQQPASRGAQLRAQLPGELVIPLAWEDNNAPSRGLVSSALKLVGINIFKNVADTTGRDVAKKIAEHIEQNNQNIVYSCDEKFNLAKQFKASDAKAGAKYLLFIHGTGSDTKGGFSGLINKTGEGAYNALYTKYEGRIIAYEHKTFSQSPVQNILELVKQLPDTIILDVISHSRGGLLGELLARISSQAFDGVFSAEEMHLLQQNDEAKSLVDEINTLNTAIKNKKIKVEQFIRVACPAAGTTLVSDRADKLLNVFFNLLSFIPGEIASTVIEGITALLTAIVNEKNNTSILPGIECMKPDSSFIKALNYNQTKIDSELIVIAGDAVGEGFVNKIKMFLVDSFYKENNDLVVNTASMKKGTGRSKDFLIYDEQAADVNHFHYFINDSSQKIILNVLAGNVQATRGLYSSSVLNKPAVPDVTQSVSRSGKSIQDQPVLYVLPGIMGSKLKADNDEIWLNFLKVATGCLNELAIEKDVEAVGIIGSTYKKLVDYFSNYYYVIPFPYDWRRSIFDAADALNVHIKETLSQGAKSISFIAHSMGGLVFRAFALKHEADTWKEVNEKGNCRALLLGTPHLGSYAVPRLFMGIDRRINALAALDLTSSKKKLICQFIEYNGLLELLPSKSVEDFANEEIWNKMKSISGFNYDIPSKALDGYKQMKQDGFHNYRYDASIVKYIAGRSDQTPERLEIDEDNNRINFYGTPEGDGTVTWDTIPAELLNAATYYVNTEHGSLARNESSFQGYKELLEKGTTTLLSNIQPATRSEIKTELMPELEQVTVPDNGALADYIMGIEPEAVKIPKQQVAVSITHGDLGHASYPLVVGHFKGDGIVEAEKVLDRKLNGYLSLMHATNNYPGDIGTHEVILPSPPDAKGAIIVGLGDFGTLTENLLTRTIRQALLSFITRKKDSNDSNSNGLSGISCLLIGTGFAGLTIYSSVKALLSAVQEANRFFENAGFRNYSFINKIEIVELYQHKAVQAGRILRSLITLNSLFSNMAFVPNLIKKGSGARAEIPDEMQTDWWHRLKIAEKEEESFDNKVVSRVITFSSITDKARNEEEVLNTNISIVDNLITQAASYTNHNIKLCQTLYELLVPNGFKGYGSDLRNIVLLLDKETARYPWEMMMDAYGDSKEPLVTKTGFLRQLATSTYRENVEMPVMNNALVVGNPTLNGYYPDLPAAGMEAEQVAILLEKFGYAVNKDYINKEAAGVITELYPRPYKILHIAAHGVLTDKTTGQTGIVLGPGVILTPSDFEQVRKVPELVFINCCSLGTINKEDEQRLQRKYKVAAGIGTQLIEMGVKAVIVAGWEVNDDAALNFSYTFYTEMLNGQKFGDAVKNARESTYTKYPDSNTWGAYQCYGDPLYALRPITEGRQDDDINFCDPIEAIDKLNTLISQAEAASSRDDKDYIKNGTKKVIAAIQLHPEWKYNASITELIAELYKQNGMTDDAVYYYELLFSMEDANYTVKTIEQYCNVKVKQAIKTYKKISDDKTKTEKEKNDAFQTAIATISDIIKKLENLNIRPTAERLNLIASAYRRLADMSIDMIDKDAYINSLLMSAYYYHEGYATYSITYSKPYYYPLHNWLVIGVILQKLVPEIEDQYKAAVNIPSGNDLYKILQDADDYAKELDDIKPDFWNKTSASAKFLLKLLLATAVKDIIAFKDAIMQNHTQAWKTEGSVDKQNAISEHADFLIRMFNTYKEQLQELQLIDEKIQAMESLKQALG